jgi:hypothetical protein
MRGISDEIVTAKRANTNTMASVEMMAMRVKECE